jgi:hypothetical protein
MKTYDAMSSHPPFFLSQQAAATSGHNRSREPRKSHGLESELGLTGLEEDKKLGLDGRFHWAASEMGVELSG